MAQHVLGGGPLVDESTARQIVVSSQGRTFLLNEQASVVSVNVTPSSGALVLHGQTPTVTTAVAVTPSSGAIVLHGQVPTVFISRNVTPSAGALVLTGQIPTVTAASANSPHWLPVARRRGRR